MAHRSLIFAFLAVCLIYVIQASPMPQDGAQATSGPNTADVVYAAAAKTLEAARDGFNAIMNDPNVLDARTTMQRGAEYIAREFQQGAQALAEGAKKLVPQTQ